jgi:hypothetical protein
MANFESDLSQEIILSKYLDQLYKSKNLEFERIFDLDRQHQGIDILIQVNSVEYSIDEKAQLHYINKDLPTFTFELSYLKDHKLKNGWLLDDNKLTEYYFLITGIFLKTNKKILQNVEDIDKLKVTSVNRKKLIEHLATIGLKKETLLDYDSKIREENTFGKIIITELDSKKEGLIYFTEHLNEKPINIQLRLQYLIENNIAKKFNYV